MKTPHLVPSLIQSARAAVERGAMLSPEQARALLGALDGVADLANVCLSAADIMPDAWIVTGLDFVKQTQGLYGRDDHAQEEIDWLVRDAEILRAWYEIHGRKHRGEAGTGTASPTDPAPEASHG